MIKLERVSKIYNNNGVLTTGLHNINLELEKNEIVAIVGESGSGKSTLLNVLTKMDSFDEGEYYYKGNETSYFDVNDMDNFRKDKVGFIFQNYNIIDSYTVLENVMLPFIIKGENKKDAKIKAKELINKVGLNNRIKNKGTELSGGEKQRCVIARALASDCEILACDEPTGNLDSKTGEEIIKLIKEVANDKLVLIVTHNYDQVKDIATRKIKIKDGEIIEDVIFQKKEKDPNEKLELEYKPINNKIKLDIAKDNIKNTPKKTIFTSVVLFFVAMFSLFLFQGISYLTNNQSYINNFVYKGEDKIIVYDINNKELDIKKIENISKKYVVNDFYRTNNNLYFRIDNSAIVNSFNYEEYPYNYKLDDGRKANNGNEVEILLPSTYSGEDFLNQNITINDMNYKYKIVGYQIREDITDIVFTNNKQIEDLLLINRILSYKVEIKYKTGYQIREIDLSVEFNNDLENSYIEIDKSYDLNNVIIEDKNIVYSDLYEFDYNLKTLEIKTGEDNKIIVGQDFINCVKQKPYEVSIYPDNIFIAENELNNINYSYVRVKTYDTTSPMQRFINNIMSYLMMLLSSLTIIIIFFISYIILAKIYTSRKKDYVILRTLGISKFDMKGIVINEIMSLTLIITIISYLIIFIISRFTNKGIMIIFNNISIFGSILYFIIMILFGYLIARRFNRKLFKFSVNSTLKGYDKRD